MYDKNHYNIVISLQLIKINGKKKRHYQIKEDLWEKKKKKQLFQYFRDSKAQISFSGGSVVKNLPANAGDTRDIVLIPGQEDPLEKEMATHCNILAWKISWTEEPGRLHGISESQTWLSTAQRKVQIKPFGHP